VSGNGSKKSGASTRLVQVLALLVVFLIVLSATRLAPHFQSSLGTVSAIGFLLLSGTLLSELLETIGLPHLSGYLLAGIVGGPYLLHIVDHETVEQLSPVNTLALALIALAGGAELRVRALRSVARSVSYGLVLQSAVGVVTLSATFMLLSRYIPFASALPLAGLVSVALLWGTLSVSRSPSACLGVLAQTRARGPLSSYSLAFIMGSDVVVVVMMACVIVAVRPLMTGGGGISMENLQVLGHEIVGSIAMGTSLGLALAAYLRLVGKNLMLVLVALGFGLTELMRYIHIDPLLSFLTAGFVVQNLSAQGDRLLHAVEQASGLVFIVFFATAGAHLDLPLLGQLWPIALALCSARACVTVCTARWSSHLAQDPPVIRRWGWSGLISQAGLTLGLSVVIVRTFPEFGEGFRALVIATVALNEMVGPVLFKLALDRSGEAAAGSAAAALEFAAEVSQVAQVSQELPEPCNTPPLA
jgi:Kef-type K+ transport system membrane component KefB